MNTLPPTQQSGAAGWHKLAQRTARRVNAAWWLSFFAPLLLAAGAAGCAVLLLLRYKGVFISGGQAALWLGLSAFVMAGVAWLLARRHFCPQDQALVRLEMHMGLNNALSTASQGVAAWPPLPAAASDALRADLKRVLLPVAGAAALIAAGLLLPVAQAGAAVTPPPPRSHSEIQSAIDLLKQADVLNKEDLEKLQKQLDELKQQDPTDWYSHASQEAADSLREGMSQSLREMSQNLDKGVKSMNTLTQQTESSPQDRERAASDFQQAMKGLMNSPLGLNEKLKEQLSKIDPGQLKSLDQGQLADLKKAMEKCSGACKDGCDGGGEGEGEGSGNKNGKGDAGDGKAKGPGDGQGEGEGEGEGSEQTGRGGVARGPGVAPLPLAREGSPQNGGDASPLESKDLSQARPGDAFGVSDATHNPDKTPAGPQSGGSISAPGSGGDAVGSESLVPADRAVLKQYFQ